MYLAIKEHNKQYKLFMTTLWNISPKSEILILATE